MHTRERAQKAAPSLSLGGCTIKYFSFIILYWFENGTSAVAGLSATIRRHHAWPNHNRQTHAPRSALPLHVKGSGIGFRGNLILFPSFLWGCVGRPSPAGLPQSAAHTPQEQGRKKGEKEKG